MESLIERAINLAKITKDNVIIADKENNEGYVVMDLAKYEKLILKKTEELNEKSLTDKELIDKINRDIAYSKEEVNSNDVEEEKELVKPGELPVMEDTFSVDDNISDNDNQNIDNPEENMYYYNENENTINDNTFSFKTEFTDEKDKSRGWKIPSEIKNRAEEID